jgi:hypothetical protein
MLARFLVAGALLLAHPVNAADEFRSECRIGMSESEFARANSELLAQGLRLVDITVTEVKGRPVVGAIWNRFSRMPAGTPERAQAQSALVFLKLDEDGLRAKGEALSARGSQVEVIDAYQVDGRTWFAASFSPAGEATMQSVGAFLTAEQAKGMREEAISNNHDYARMDVYTRGDQVMLLPVFVARGEAEIEAKFFDRTISISAAGAGMYLKDMHPLAISAFEQDGKAYWMAMWDKGPPRDFILTDAGNKIRERIAAGGVVLDLDSHAAYDGSVSYYAVVQGGKP